MDLHGFTMLELIIVLVILGIIAAVAIPTWQGTGINVSSEADHLAADLLYTQSLAINSGQRYYWIRTGTNTYQIRNSSNVAIIYPGSGSSTITLKAGISFSTFTNLTSIIAFDGKGQPYTTSTTPGTRLATSATIRLIGDTVTKSVIIFPSTGYVQIQ
ncbi:MAG TPA: GspH/FimT family pseudopilin [Gammaproteobacteria bacterium]|jgi:prepilin-type N-terminal cleavage/methylation domain-containing protein|nr:GspH/FimT family pseudopilin [Gammaproteobacteria bacterium]